MRNGDNGKPFWRDTAESSLAAFGSLLAFIATLMLSGWMYEATDKAVYVHFLNTWQDRDLAAIATVVWHIACNAAVFMILRSLFYIAILIIIQRGFVYLT